MTAALLRFAMTVAALPLCAQFMDGVVIVDLRNALTVGLALAVLFTVLRPLIRLLLAVINFLTLGLLYTVADAWLIWTAVGYVENSVQLESFWWAVAVAVVLNAARSLLDVIVGDSKR
jgi:uncharacterized membrane protein YvlD (DUF360 family)